MMWPEACVKIAAIMVGGPCLLVLLFLVMASKSALNELIYSVANRSPVTKTCHACGSLEDFDAEASIYHTCSQCGARWDQDENAAKNMLKIHCESPGHSKIVGSARNVDKLDENGQPKESRYDRVARKRAEKLARMDTARNSVPNHTESLAT